MRMKFMFFFGHSLHISANEHKQNECHFKIVFSLVLVILLSVSDSIVRLYSLFFILNPLVTNGLSHFYHLDESTFILRGIRSIFSIFFSMKFIKANRIARDGTPRFAASHLGLFCLPMSHKKYTRLIWVKNFFSKCMACMQK